MGEFQLFGSSRDILGRVLQKFKVKK